MSTTVSYKGATIATVSNNTKTLLTEGKYLEDDLTLTDVSGGGAVLTTKNISANGTYNASSDSADGYSQVNVAVPASAVDTGTKSITSNGTHDVVGYASASVAVPNSYSAGDEGKVVSNGALVAQTSDTVTENDTYDTTLINSLTVNVSGGGGGTSAEWNDVCFWDYDGTIVASYSAADFANLSALPANPSHDGLTAQGWNWTLADAKSHVATHGFLDIGHLYVPTDGKTHIHILVDDAERKTRFLYLKCSVASAMTIDWGDESPTETNSNTSANLYTHDYATTGEYEILLSTTSGTITLGNGSADNALMRNNTNQSYWSQASIQAVEIGNNIALANNCFSNTYNMKTLTLPNNVTYGDSVSCFANTGLIMLTLPNPYGVNSTGALSSYAGQAVCFPKQGHIRCGWSSLSSRTLKRVCIPVLPLENQGIREGMNLRRFLIDETATQLRTQFLTSPYSVVELIFPEALATVNGIDAYLYSLKSVHAKATTPPTLSSGMFNNTPSDMVIYVPYSSDHSVLAAYQTATNWSSYASKMQEEPQ